MNFDIILLEMEIASDKLDNKMFIETIMESEQLERSYTKKNILSKISTAISKILSIIRNALIKVRDSITNLTNGTVYKKRISDFEKGVKDGTIPKGKKISIIDIDRLNKLHKSYRKKVIESNDPQKTLEEYEKNKKY